MSRRNSVVLADARRRGAPSVTDPWVNERLPQNERYKLDPWAHVDDGHVIIQDLETMTAQIWVPWQHQRELVEAWIDLDYLRRPPRRAPASCGCTTCSRRRAARWE
jgi:hypothetical protein